MFVLIYILLILFLVVIIILYIKDNKNKSIKYKNLSSLIQTIFVFFAFGATIFTIQMAINQNEESKQFIEEQKGLIKDQINTLKQIDTASSSTTNNLSVISKYLDSIAYKFSQFPIQIDEISRSLILLNKASNKQNIIQKKQFELQVSPYLEAHLIEEKTSEIFFSKYYLELVNSGINAINDIRIDRFFLYFDLRTNSLFGGISNLNYFWKEIKTIKSFDTIKYKIEEDDINRIIKSGKTDYDDGTKNIIRILLYKIYYKREVDKKEYYVKKYFEVIADKKDYYWLEDLDNPKLGNTEIFERVKKADKISN